MVILEHINLATTQSAKKVQMKNLFNNDNL
jgi:hypothetical protein